MLFYMTMLDSSRDKDKFQQIYQRYYQPMYRTALRILGDDPGAQDCVHDAFMKIISRLDDIPEAEDARTRSFVLIVVRNTAINLYRKRKLREQTVIEDDVICHLPQLWVYDRYDIGDQEGRIRKRIFLLIAAVFILSVTAVTASRGFIMRSGERTGIIRELEWGIPSEEISLPIGGTVTFAKEEKSEILHGWSLEKEEEIHLSFQTESLFYMQHSIKIQQALEMGYIYQGEFYPADYIYEELEEQEQLKFSADIQMPEEGEYCFYIKNLCSEDILLKNMCLS
ncbi:MAG: RNA polymerase sigma factor [Ruminococcus sp.]|jgi:RNA polymerase sigma factor (sigma-70 family)